MHECLTNSLPDLCQEFPIAAVCVALAARVPKIDTATVDIDFLKDRRLQSREIPSHQTSSLITSRIKDKSRCHLHHTSSLRMCSKYVVHHHSDTTERLAMLTSLIASPRTHCGRTASSRSQCLARTCHVETVEKQYHLVSRTGDAFVCRIVRRFEKRKIRQRWIVPVQKYRAEQQCRNN